jgi:hypothetical protein
VSSALQPSASSTECKWSLLVGAGGPVAGRRQLNRARRRRRGGLSIRQSNPHLRRSRGTEQTRTGPAQASLLANVVYALLQLDIENLVGEVAHLLPTLTGFRPLRRTVNESGESLRHGSERVGDSRGAEKSTHRLSGSDLCPLESKVVARQLEAVESGVRGGRAIVVQTLVGDPSRSASAAGAQDSIVRNDCGSAGPTSESRAQARARVPHKAGETAARIDRCRPAPKPLRRSAHDSSLALGLDW